eukprot:3566591-Amphidinium_carterae.1
MDQTFDESCTAVHEWTSTTHSPRLIRAVRNISPEIEQRPRTRSFVNMRGYCYKKQGMASMGDCIIQIKFTQNARLENLRCKIAYVCKRDAQFG